MARLRDLWFRTKALFSGRRMERELDEELGFHLDMQTRKLVDEGWSEDDARREARRRFGSANRQRDQVRWTWGVGWVRDLVSDGRLLGRQLIRNPGFAVGAILTLALGIGANTAIFSIARQALLRAPSVVEPGRLAAIYTTCRRGQLRCSSSYPDYEDYRDLTASFSDVAAYSPVPLNVGTETTARLATGLLVTGNYFPLLGLAPAHGRLLGPADDPDGGGVATAVVGHAFWRDALGGDPSAVGRTIRLNGATFQVVGVAPEGFEGLALASRPDIWLPIRSASLLGPGVGGAGEPDVTTNRRMRWIGTVLGRLAPGASIERARAEMDALAARLGSEYPDERAAIDGVRQITVDELNGFILPVGSEESLQGFVIMLGAVVLMTLLLASANLANLLLARATARGREIGVRFALGAGRARVLRQLLTESLLLSLIGGAAGLLVARIMLGLLSGFELPGGVPLGTLGIGLQPDVLLFALGTSVLAALLFGLAPALHATRPDLAGAVKGEAGARKGFGAVRRGLVSVQVALCLVLLVGSGLFLRTLRNSLDSRLGFDPAGTVAARFNLSLLGYSEAAAQNFLARLLSESRALPGVTAASVGSLVPFQGGGFRGTFAEIDGYVPAPDEEIRIDWVGVGEDYFASLGTRVLDGREISRADGDEGRIVAVVNEHMANRYWEGSPVGRTIRAFGTDVEVIGVVENPTWQSIGEEATPFVFLPQAPLEMAASTFFTLTVRTDGDPRALVPLIRERFRALEPELSLTFLSPMDDLVGDALMPQRLGTVLLTLLGGLALILAAVGVYGVVSYSVRQSAREIGVRIAVGASQGRILASVWKRMLVPVAIGLGLGTVAALWLSGSIESFMYGIGADDPWTIGAIALLLAAVASGATLIPARAAARLDPAKVLRTD